MYKENGIYALILAKTFQVIMVLANITIDDSQAQIEVEVNQCNSFTLHTSSLFLFKCREISIDVFPEQCTNTSVVFKTIQVESTVTFSFSYLLSITITDMKVYAIPTDFTISNSHIGFKDTYMVNNDITDINRLNNNIDISDSNVSFHGNTTIAYYRADDSNIRLKNSALLFTGNAKFTNNTSLTNAGVIEAAKSIVTFEGNITFIGNQGYSGAIKATEESVIAFTGNVSFIANKGHSGGAIALYEDSYLRLHNSTNIVFKSNTAKAYGGAIYIIAKQKDFIFQTSANIDLLVSSFKDLNSQCFFMPYLMTDCYGPVSKSKFSLTTTLLDILAWISMEGPLTHAFCQTGHTGTGVCLALMSSMLAYSDL